jgi:hydrogenase maturation protein HypF
MSDKRRCRLMISGVVQGVGFRPFVYRTAVRLDLAGAVQNSPSGVIIEVEGDRKAIDEFRRLVQSNPPPLSSIDSIKELWLDPIGIVGFDIGISHSAGQAQTLIPPDVATCRLCREELVNPRDRRFRYAFINCTDCGPRYTIIQSVPYDRRRTTMDPFTMCTDCAAEYDDPRTRRFHAEPNACPACGPQVRLCTPSGESIETEDPVWETASRLSLGEIVAVKGIGGFHLAANASDEAVVKRLRTLKERGAEPFAVMVADLDRIRTLAELSEDEENLLHGPSAPIVLLEKRRPFPLAESVAPDTPLIGVMLPYSPLHHMLLADAGDLILVMTSANPRNEPIVRDNEEALQRLKGIADSFLLHDRDILARADDSVALVQSGRPRMIRRSRGYTPLPVKLPLGGPSVLAMGGDLKNAFCVTRGTEAFFGPHIGDLENSRTASHFGEAVTHLCDLLEVTPEIIVHDLHPDYVSTRLARRLLKGRFSQARRIEVQHHHAHILSALAENGKTGPALGIAIDGTGYGTDGTIWGCEILSVKGRSFERISHLKPLRLPGGDLAARQIWRLAVAALSDLAMASLIEPLQERWPNAPAETVRSITLAMVGRYEHPRSSGLGRHFDLVCALLGLCDTNSYDSEAPRVLENIAKDAMNEADPYPYSLQGPTINLDEAIREIAGESVQNAEPSMLAARFHATVIEALFDAACAAREKTGLDLIALSGGSVQNRILFERLVRRLERTGFAVLTHSQVPANDGGLALGQAVAGLLHATPTRD